LSLCVPITNLWLVMFLSLKQNAHNQLIKLLMLIS
jgi:hypothetical protein